MSGHWENWPAAWRMRRLSWTIPIWRERTFLQPRNLPLIILPKNRSHSDRLSRAEISCGWMLWCQPGYCSPCRRPRRPLYPRKQGRNVRRWGLTSCLCCSRILLTEDKDFGDLVYRLKKPANGIILIRIDIQERHMKWPRLKTLIDKYEDRLSGHFIVLEMNRIRFRPLIL